MKTFINIILLICFLLILFSFRNNYVKANVFLQTTSSSSGSIESSSSSSSGSILSSSSSGSQNAISSSSSGASNTSSSSSSGKILSNSSSGSVQSSSSSGSIDLNKRFPGIWSGIIKSQQSNCVTCPKILPKCSSSGVLVSQSCSECAHCNIVNNRDSNLYNQTNNKSKVNLRLCLNNNTLKGNITLTNSVTNSSITSSHIINQNKVLITYKEGSINRDATLELINNKKLLIDISEKGIFKAKKIKLIRSCNQVINPCKELENEIDSLIEEANFCTNDNDCIVVQNGICPFECYNLSNKNISRSEIIDKIANYIFSCKLCSYTCSTPPANSSLECINNKCIEK